MKLTSVKGFSTKLNTNKELTFSGNTTWRGKPDFWGETPLITLGEIIGISYKLVKAISEMSDFTKFNNSRSKTAPSRP